MLAVPATVRLPCTAVFMPDRLMLTALALAAPMLIAAPAPVSMPMVLAPVEAIVKLLPAVILKAAVDLSKGVVTLVLKDGLATVPTVRVPPRATVPPPVMLVPLLIVMLELA